MAGSKPLRVTGAVDGCDRYSYHKHDLVDVALVVAQLGVIVAVLLVAAGWLP